MSEFMTGLWLQVNDGEDDMEIVLGQFPVPGCDDGAHAFLHGICGIFALALHDIFGYALDWCVEDDFEYADDPVPMDYLVHVFCFDEERAAFIDVRGITTSMEAFFEEFEDFFTPPGIYVGDLDAEMLKQTMVSDMGNKTYEDLYAAACALIQGHRSWYEMP